MTISRRGFPSRLAAFGASSADDFWPLLATPCNCRADVSDLLDGVLVPLRTLFTAPFIVVLMLMLSAPLGLRVGSVSFLLPIKNLYENGANPKLSIQMGGRSAQVWIKTFG